MQSPFGVREDEHSEARLPELAFVLSRERKLDVVPGFLFPDREPLMAEINFDERGVDAGGRSELEIAIRDKAEAGNERRIEGQPVDKSHLGDGYRSKFQITVDGVDRELMLDKEVGDEHFVLPPARATAGNLDHLRALYGQRIERLASPAGTEKKSPQEPGADESEQSRVNACRRSEPCGNLQLLPVRHAHNAERPQEFEVSRLHDEAAPLALLVCFLNSSHGVPHPSCG